MADQVNWGIIGLSIGLRRGALEGFGLDRKRGFKDNPNSKLLALADVSEKVRAGAEDSIAKSGFESEVPIYSSMEEMLGEQPKIQAVYIATDNLSHLPLGLQAIHSGRHVFLEKPMATTIEGALALMYDAQVKGLSTGVDHMMRYNAYNQLAIELTKNGTVGDFDKGTFAMEFLYGATPDERATWRVSNPFQLGGPNGDVAGSHCAYMAEAAAGAPIAKLSAHYGPKKYNMPCEESIIIDVEFANGKTAQLKGAFNDDGGKNTLRDLGMQLRCSEGDVKTEGSLFQFSGDPDIPDEIGGNLIRDLLKVIVIRDGKEKVVKPEGHIPNIYQSVISDFSASILRGEQRQAYDGAHNLSIILAAHYSAQNNGKLINMEQFYKDIGLADGLKIIEARKN